MHRLSGFGLPINQLLGAPERLLDERRRRSTREHRLVYHIEAGVLQIAQCRFHY